MSELERSAKSKEYVPSEVGDYGGPLCGVVAKYEDGTEILFSPEKVSKWIECYNIVVMTQRAFYKI